MKTSRKRRAYERAERLENRLYWSVSQDANGWTVVTPTANENIIYVSNEGSDSNGGTTQATSVRTLVKAQSLMINNAPNQLLLKAGETYSDPKDAFVGWSASGQDAQNPILISYYGAGTRPLIYTGSNGVAFSTTNFSVSSSAIVNYVDIIGLQFEANLRDPTLYTSSQILSSTGGSKGFEFYAKGGNTLVEDCSFQYYGYNADIESPPGMAPVITNITLRRDVFANAYAVNSGRSQGMYAFNVDHLTVLQSDWDHNGWNATAGLGSVDIGYNHNMYIASTCTNVDIEGNIIAQASYCGLLARSGGIVNNNLFISNTVACSYGAADGADSTVGGVTGSFIGNTIVGDKAEYSDTSSPLPYGQGLVIANVNTSGLMVSGNLFTADSQNAKACIQLTMATGTYNKDSTVGLNNVTIQNNVFNGWRYTFQTDGRFVAGGTGLYALNGLKVTKNDIVSPTSATVSLARHDGAFAFSAESWSLDRYYDPAANSKWITLTGSALPFATWASTYDIGATALSALPYSDPSRTIATYDTTLGGNGTFTDYLAHAAQLSISNYQTQYMATAAASYVQAGFNIVSTTGTQNTAATTAQATTTNVTLAQSGATTYSFTINFTGGGSLKTGSLGTGNLLVTGPNGFSQLATFVSLGTSTTDSAGYQHTPVTYRITPSSGSWGVNRKQDGTYTISLLANQVSDLNGNVVPDGLVGTFAVDLTAPTATTIASAVSASSGSYEFSIAYFDPAGIDPNTLYNGQVQVTGPNGFIQYATLGTTTASTNGTGIVAKYTITPPGGSWLATANGTYTIAIGANMVYDLAGNPLAAGTLGTFAVQVSGGSTLGTASISGTVFNDANGDGVISSRELMMVGVTLFIDNAGTGVYTASDPTAVTDANGAYSFAGLAAGRYTIFEATPAGFGLTTATTVLTLTATQVVTGFNFANQMGATTINSTASPGSSTSAGAVPNTPPAPLKTAPPVRRATV